MTTSKTLGGAARGRRYSPRPTSPTVGRKSPLDSRGQVCRPKWPSRKPFAWLQQRRTLRLQISDAAQERRKPKPLSSSAGTEHETGRRWLGLGDDVHNGDPTNGLERCVAVWRTATLGAACYLGKGYTKRPLHRQPAGQFKQLFRPGDTNRAALLKRAEEELNMARMLDSNDPTPDLYSALIKQQQNRINEAVRELERSKELNDNRAVIVRISADEDQARQCRLACYRRVDRLTCRYASRASDRIRHRTIRPIFFAESFDSL
jgi:hypothetical protein